jgi:calcineurin-like phosphoesterase family protein
MNQVYFTSDLHLGHKNIIQYCQRPFASVEEMDHALIRAWNARVGPQDMVYVLGDFAFESRARSKAALAQLAGRKILIRGNHDQEKDDEGWDEVHDALLFEVGNTRFYLHHYPLRDWPGRWHNVIHLYGHVHGNLEPLPGSMDVGVDTWGGAPVALEEVLQAVVPFDRRKEPRAHYVQKAWKEENV